MEWTVVVALLIAAGCLWLAYDFGRRRAVFGWLFGLLAAERLFAAAAGSGGNGLPGAALVAGLAGPGVSAALSLALAAVVGRVVLGRLLYVWARRRGIVTAGDD